MLNFYDFILVYFLIFFDNFSTYTSAHFFPFKFTLFDHDSIEYQNISIECVAARRTLFVLRFIGLLGSVQTKYETGFYEVHLRSIGTDFMENSNYYSIFLIFYGNLACLILLASLKSELIINN